MSDLTATQVSDRRAIVAAIKALENYRDEGGEACHIGPLSVLSALQRHVDGVMLRTWAEGQTLARLRALANGMPYLHESKKAEIITWLLQYNRDALQRARNESEEDPA